MALTPLADMAMRASNRQIKPREEVNAVVAAMQPMNAAIEAQSGMVGTGDVLKSNLYTGQGQSDAQRTYFEALSRMLPQYVNSYRAYQKEKAKASSGSGTGGGYAVNPTYQPMEFSLSQLFPQMSGVPDVVRDQWYITSPYGAMGYGSNTPEAALARKLAAGNYLGTTKTTK